MYTRLKYETWNTPIHSLCNALGTSRNKHPSLIHIHILYHGGGGIVQGIAAVHAAAGARAAAALHLFIIVFSSFRWHSLSFDSHTYVHERSVFLYYCMCIFAIKQRPKANNSILYQFFLHFAAVQQNNNVYCGSVILIKSKQQPKRTNQYTF